MRPIVVVAVAGWSGMGFSVLAGPPLYPEIARDLHTAPDGLGLAVGSASIVALAFQIPMGLASDRIGTRPLLIGGAALIAVACAVRAAAPDLLIFALSQGLLGLAVPAFQAGSFTGLANTFTGARLTTALAYCFSGFNVGLVLSSVLAGALGAQFGWRATLVVLALFPAAVLPIALRVAETSRGTRVDAGLRELAGRTMRFLFERGPFTLAIVALVSQWCAVANVFALPFALRETGVDAAATGVLLSANVLGSIVSPPLLSAFMRRIGLRSVVVGGFAASAVAIALLTAIGVVPAVVAVSFFLLGASLGGIGALTQGRASTYSSNTGVGQGAALSAMRLIQSFGAGLGPTMAGAIYVHAGFGGAQVVGIALLVIGTALVLSLPPERAVAV